MCIHYLKFPSYLFSIKIKVQKKNIKQISLLLYYKQKLITVYNKIGTGSLKCSLKGCKKLLFGRVGNFHITTQFSIQQNFNLLQFILIYNLISCNDILLFVIISNEFLRDPFHKLQLNVYGKLNFKISLPLSLKDSLNVVSLNVIDEQ